MFTKSFLGWQFEEILEAQLDLISQDLKHEDPIRSTTSTANINEQEYMGCQFRERSSVFGRELISWFMARTWRNMIRYVNIEVVG